MDARVLGALDALPCGIDVIFGATRETADDRRLGLRAASDRGLPAIGADVVARREVAGRSSGAPGLDDVHAEACEGAGHLELFARGHRCRGKLLAVAQAGVEDSN